MAYLCTHSQPTFIKMERAILPFVMKLPKTQTESVSGPYVLGGICDIPFHSTARGCRYPQKTGSPAAAWGAEPDWDRKAETLPGRPSGPTETTPASSPTDWHTEWQTHYEYISPVWHHNITVYLDKRWHSWRCGSVCFSTAGPLHCVCSQRGSKSEMAVTDLRLMSSGGRTSWQEEPSLVRTEKTCPRSLHTTSSAASAPLRLHSTVKTMLVSRLHSSSSGVCCKTNNTWILTENI